MRSVRGAKLSIRSPDMRTLSIKIPNVSESLSHKLEWLILGGAFWPDQPLASERKLSEELDVSRTSLRNALGRLRDMGLLMHDGKHYYSNSVMADLLAPGLDSIAADNPSYILDYWLMMFAEAVMLAERKAQTNDRIAIQRAADRVKQALSNNDTKQAIASLEDLFRHVLNGCYNYFLSQTHFALGRVMGAPFEAALSKLRLDVEAQTSFLTAINDLTAFRFDAPAFRDIFEAEFQIPTEVSVSPSDGAAVSKPTRLIDAVLRHPLSFEAVFELRQITETHAAGQAAAKRDTTNNPRLAAHVEEMTVAVDFSPSEYSKLDTVFHNLVAESSQNPVFVVVDTALAPLFSSTTSQWLERHQEMRLDQTVIHLQHIQIFDAIEAGDAAAATGAMHRHLSYVLSNLKTLRDQVKLQEIGNARFLLGGAVVGRT